MLRGLISFRQRTRTYQEEDVADWCAQGQKELVKAYLKHAPQPNPNAIKSGSTALHQACAHNHLPIVELLVRKGADVELADPSGMMPLHISCMRGHLQISKFLVSPTNLPAEDFSAIDLDSKQAIEKCRILADPECHTDDDEKQTPLHLAVSHNQIDMVRWLLKDIEVDASCKDANGETILHKACTRGLLEMVKLLVNHDASLVRVEDRRKRFPIHCACEIGNLEIFQYLVEKAGADIDQIDNQTIARYSQHSNIVWQQVIYECKKSVVLIAVFDKKKDRQVQIGSGFVNQEGLIVTAAHILSDKSGTQSNEKELYVGVFPKYYSEKVVWRYVAEPYIPRRWEDVNPQENDVCMLRLSHQLEKDVDSGRPFPSISKIPRLDVFLQPPGSMSLFDGNPGALLEECCVLGFHQDWPERSQQEGIVRSVHARFGHINRRDGQTLVIDNCRVQGGDSGGPIVDKSGFVLGIVSKSDDLRCYAVRAKRIASMIA